MSSQFRALGAGSGTCAGRRILFSAVGLADGCGWGLIQSGKRVRRTRYLVRRRLRVGVCALECFGTGLGHGRCLPRWLLWRPPAYAQAAKTATAASRHPAYPAGKAPVRVCLTAASLP